MGCCFSRPADDEPLLSESRRSAKRLAQASFDSLLEDDYDDDEISAISVQSDGMLREVPVSPPPPKGPTTIPEPALSPVPMLSPPPSPAVPSPPVVAISPPPPSRSKQATRGAVGGATPSIIPADLEPRLRAALLSSCSDEEVERLLAAVQKNTTKAVVEAAVALGPTAPAPAVFTTLFTKRKLAREVGPSAVAALETFFLGDERALAAVLAHAPAAIPGLSTASTPPAGCLFSGDTAIVVKNKLIASGVSASDATAVLVVCQRLVPWRCLESAIHLDDYAPDSVLPVLFPADVRKAVEEASSAVGMRALVACLKEDVEVFDAMLERINANVLEVSEAKMLVLPPAAESKVASDLVEQGTNVTLNDSRHLLDSLRHVLEPEQVCEALEQESLAPQDVLPVLFSPTVKKRLKERGTSEEALSALLTSLEADHDTYDAMLEQLNASASMSLRVEELAQLRKELEEAEEAAGGHGGHALIFPEEVRAAVEEGLQGDVSLEDVRRVMDVLPSVVPPGTLEAVMELSDFSPSSVLPVLFPKAVQEAAAQVDGVSQDAINVLLDILTSSEGKVVYDAVMRQVNADALVVSKREELAVLEREIAELHLTSP